MSTPLIKALSLGMRPINGITPFTYRDGRTYLEVLEALRDHINVVIDEVNTTQKNLTEDLAEIISSFNSRAGWLPITEKTLTEDFVLEVDESWPAEQPILFRFIQNIVGGHTLTFGEGITNPELKTVGLMPGDITEFYLYPTPSGWEVRNGTRLPNLSVGDEVTRENTLVIGGDGYAARTPYRSTSTLKPSLPGTQDFVAHLLKSVIKGDFTGVSSTNPGWAWGSNLYTQTLPGSEHGKGINYLTGSLIELSLAGEGFTGRGYGLMAEAAYIGQQAGGHASALTSLMVANPKRKDGATRGTAGSVYGLYVEAVPEGSLDSTEAYSLYVAGGMSRLAGKVFVGDTFSVNENSKVWLGGVSLEKGSSGSLQVNGTIRTSGSLNATGAVTSQGNVLGEQFAQYSDSSRKILWGQGSPEGVVSASTGSIYLQHDAANGNSPVWEKTAGGLTGWRRRSASYSGTGSPEGVVTAMRGAMYTRTDGAAGSTLYVKETGDNTSTGWTAK